MNDYEYDERLSRLTQSKQKTCYNCICFSEENSELTFGVTKIECKHGDDSYIFPDKTYIFPVGVTPTCARFNKRKPTPEEQLFEHETRLQMLEQCCHRNGCDLNGIN